jgi:hypothetical protein
MLLVVFAVKPFNLFCKTISLISCRLLVLARTAETNVLLSQSFKKVKEGIRCVVREWEQY